MFRRFTMVFITMLLAVTAVLIAAMNPTGPNTVSYEEPLILLLTIGFVIALCLPPLILAFFNQLVVKIISAIYQAFIVFTFILMIPIGFIVPDILIILNGALGAVVGISSIVVTLMVGLKKETES